MSELPGIEIPSIEQIEKIERQRQIAIDSLQINQSDNTVRCQKCGNAIPITTNQMPKIQKKGRRVNSLRHRIEWIEKHNFGNKTENLKQLKQEYGELCEEDEKADRVRNLNLLSCKITSYKWVCSSCYDKICYPRRKTL